MNLEDFYVISVESNTNSSVQDSNFNDHKLETEIIV